jgi:hypothetical protein
VVGIWVSVDAKLAEAFALEIIPCRIVKCCKLIFELLSICLRVVELSARVKVVLDWWIIQLLVEKRQE